MSVVDRTCTRCGADFETSYPYDLCYECDIDESDDDRPHSECEDPDCIWGCNDR